MKIVTVKFLTCTISIFVFAVASMWASGILAAPGSDEIEARLRARAVVEGPIVRLSDVFDNLGPLGYAEIADSPAAGRKVAYDRTWLREVAQRHKLRWRPRPGHDSIVIERAGLVIESDAIRDAIAEDLQTRRPDSRFEIEVENAFARLVVPVNSSGVVYVRDLRVDDISGRFSAKVFAEDGEGGEARARVRGRAHQIERVPVLARQVKPGQPISMNDLGWADRRRRDIGRDVLLSTDDIIGMTVRRRNRPGYPLTTSDLQRPTVVKKGAEVTIILRMLYMTLTAQGRAKQDGALGDTIQVENSQSRRAIFALVEGPHLVGVTRTPHAGGQRAALSETGLSDRNAPVVTR